MKKSRNKSFIQSLKRFLYIQWAKRTSQTVKTFLIISSVTILLLVSTIVIIANRYDNSQKHYEEMSESLVNLDDFDTRNGEYIDTVIQYVDDPNIEDAEYIEYYHSDVMNDWLNVKKHIRGGQNKNIFGERKLSEEFYTYMNKEERDVLRDYYDYIESVLKLPREYVNSSNPKELKKIVQSIEDKSNHAPERLPIIIEKYRINVDEEWQD